MMEEGSLQGLSSREAEERRSRGEGETAAEPITKSKGRIIWENVFTLFNFLNFLIAALLAAVGAYSNMLFICIIILNIVIGIFQELKAKKLVDELSILNRPSVRIRRDGQDRKADLGELVRGDLMLLESGDQICSDAEIVEGSLEVNESLLTGESDAVVKEKGTTRSSPNCSSILEKSTEFRSILAGVPVLKRYIRIPRSFRHSVR